MEKQTKAIQAIASILSGLQAELKSDETTPELFALYQSIIQATGDERLKIFEEQLKNLPNAVEIRKQIFQIDPKVRIDRNDRQEIDNLFLPVPKLDFDKLPSFIKKVIKLYSPTSPFPDEFLVTALLPVMGAAIGTRSWIELGSLHFYPVSWALLIAPSSDWYKSTVIRRCRSFLHKKDQEMEAEYQKAYEEYQQELQHYQNLKKDDKQHVSEPKAPIRHEIDFADDETMESFYQTLHDNPDGGLLALDEAAYWIQSFDKYKKSGGEKRRWMSIFDVHPIKYKRKVDKTHLIIEKPFVSLVGGITRNTFSRTFQGVDDIENGFLPRFIFCYMPELKKADDSFMRQRIDQKKWNDLYEIFEIVMFTRTGAVAPGQKAIQRLDDWYRNHQKEKKEPEFCEELYPFWKRLEGYLLKFCLIFHLVKRAMGDTDESISLETINEAISLISYYKDQARLVVSELFESPKIKEAKHVFRVLQKHNNKMTEAEIRRSIWSYRDNQKALSEVLLFLEKRELISIREKGKSKEVEIIYDQRKSI